MAWLHEWYDLLFAGVRDETDLENYSVLINFRVSSDTICVFTRQLLKDDEGVVVAHDRLHFHFRALRILITNLQLLFVANLENSEAIYDKKCDDYTEEVNQVCF